MIDDLVTLCLKDKPNEDYEHFALLLLFQLLFKMLLRRTVLVCKIPHCRRNIFTLVLSPGSISNKGGIVVYYPLVHACKSLVMNTLSAIKPLG